MRGADGRAAYHRIGTNHDRVALSSSMFRLSGASRVVNRMKADTRMPTAELATNGADDPPTDGRT